jgi:hypothetical protein
MAMAKKRRRPWNSTHRTSEHATRRKAEPAAASSLPVRQHPLFGAIPRITVTWVDGLGREHKLVQCDPDYAPRMPPGAVRGDPHKQEFCTMCHVPRYFYVDDTRVCVQCGLSFVFRAAEQKHWYESLKFHFDSVPVRCLACRRKRRSDGAVRQQLADAKTRLRGEPEEPAALLAFAEAVVLFRQRFDAGPLAEGIAAARKARRLLRNHSNREIGEALFWEASAQALAGRSDAARSLYEEFLEIRGSGRRYVQFVKEARAWMEKSSRAIESG